MSIRKLNRFLFPCALVGIIGFSNPAMAAGSDPLESLNRKIFAFNETIDRWLMRPVADAYVELAPSPIQRGIGNVLWNLADATSVLNSVLQGRMDDASLGLARFVVNTTAGVGGLFDVGTEIGLDRRYADFGQSLARWGASSGPYLVLPVLGRSSVRDGIGVAVDALGLSVPAHLSSTQARSMIGGTALVHTRSQYVDVDDLITGDRYVFYREAYLQRRTELTGDPSNGWDFSYFESDPLDDDL
ncbi:MAG: VacJ family lipoprotein [Pseudomonadota bacterium]